MIKNNQIKLGDSQWELSIGQPCVVFTQFLTLKVNKIEGLEVENSNHAEKWYEEKQEKVIKNTIRTITRNTNTLITHNSNSNSNINCCSNLNSLKNKIKYANKNKYYSIIDIGI